MLAKELTGFFLPPMLNENVLKTLQTKNNVLSKSSYVNHACNLSSKDNHSI